MSNPITLPTVLFAGDSIRWTVAPADYPASDGWGAMLSLRNADNSIDIPASTSGREYILSASATTTDTYKAGTYQYRLRVIRNDETITIATGTMTIRPSFVGAIDERTDAQRALAAVDKLLSGKADKGVYEYEIGTRRLKSYTMSELLKLRSHLQAQVNAEQSLTSKTPFTGQRIAVRVGGGNG